MKIRNTLAGLLIVIAGLITRGAELPDAEAANEVIEQLQGALGDLSTIRALPPDQRVRWVLNQAGQRVQDKAMDEIKGQLKEAMDHYAAAAFRAQAFKDTAIPVLKNAAIFKTPVNWSVVNSRMASDINTKVNAYGTAISGATIVWDSIDAFSESGAQAGFSKMAAGVYDAVAGAYIPGWGWFKLGTTMVEGLGNYVMGYATDTATEGMLNDLFNMKGDPKGFSRMLMTTVPADLFRKVDDGWELVAFGRLWNGQGTDAGDEAMKQRLKDTLLSLKAGVAHEFAEQQRKDAELQAQFQPFLTAAAQAEERLRQTAARARNSAQPFLQVINDFQRRSGQLNEEKAIQDHQFYTALAQPAPGEILPYTPIPRGFMALYEGMYERISEHTGGSFDYEAFYNETLAANAAWNQAVANHPVPPDGWGKPEWLAHFEADKQAIQAEMQALRFAADQRANQLLQTLNAEVAVLAETLTQAKETLAQGLAALDAEAWENLGNPHSYQQYGYPEMTETWLCNGPFHRDCMGFWLPNADKYVIVASYLEQLMADAEDIASLNARRRQLYKNYMDVLTEVDRTMNTIVPDGCLVYSETVSGSETKLRLWSVDYPYYPLQRISLQRLPLEANYVLPEYVASELDVPAALAAMRNRLAELQADYDLRCLQQALQRVTDLLREKLQPFDNPGSHAYTMLARFNGILNYRVPLEQTDLYVYTEQFRTVWLACQTRLELLQRHPTLVDASPITTFGTALAQWDSAVAADREDRSRAPAQAEALKASSQQALDRWTPIWLEMSPDYYEDALGGLGNTLAIAQEYLRRGRTSTSPTYTLLTDDYLTYIPKVLNLLNQAQAEYTRILPWYSKTMPILDAVSSGSGAVGQPLSLSVQANEPGGRFNAPFLPAGLSIDPITGAISGSPTQSGDFEVLVRYLSATGVSSYKTFPLTIAPPQASKQSIALRNGLPEIQLQGPSGLSFLIQSRTGLAGDERWSTVKTLPAGETWTDPIGLPGSHRFYRVVWVP
jgi:hypothetical protein